MQQAKKEYEQSDADAANLYDEVAAYIKACCNSDRSFSRTRFDDFISLGYAAGVPNIIAATLECLSLTFPEFTSAIQDKMINAETRFAALIDVDQIVRELRNPRITPERVAALIAAGTREKTLMAALEVLQKNDKEKHDRVKPVVLAGLLGCVDVGVKSIFDIRTIAMDINKREPFEIVKDASFSNIDDSEIGWSSWIRKPRPARQDSLMPISSLKTLAHDGWKPLSLSAPILGAIIAFTLLLAAAIETLAQRSSAAGGLALSPSLDEIPALATFAYLYVPNTVAVLYSLVWSWVDLDAKRMQPWFELSKPDGATAANSLFLDYQYDFVASVPVKAAKKKHWPVFFTGTCMVIVLWLLTPLQSALLGTGVISKVEVVRLVNRAQLPPLADQRPLFDLEILNTAYATSWLGQPLPPFTTAEYAVLPYYVKDDPAPAKPGTNWTATTTKLSTELDCWPAEVSRNMWWDNVFDFLNGQGCNATIPMKRPGSALKVTGNYSMFYLSYYSSIFPDSFLEGPACPATANSTRQFLAIWAAISPVAIDEKYDWNITALYCQPSYYKQEVIAQVEATELRPIDHLVEALGPRELLTESEFNSSAFGYLISTGLPPAGRRTLDYPLAPQSIIDQNGRLAKTNISRTESNMVGFALAGQNRPTIEYAQPKVLHQVYAEAHQHLFSIAVDRLVVNQTSFANKTASSTFNISGVIVSRPISTAVEVLLLLVACFTAFILWSCYKAPCHLDANPSSIGRLVGIFRTNSELLTAFRSMDNANEDTLLESFKDERFRLIYDADRQCAELSIDTQEKDGFILGERKPALQKGYYDPIRPMIFTRKAGFAFITMIIGAIIGLSYFKSQETVQKGLPRPSRNFEVLQILENYIPTMLATLIEPFWVLLNRLLCALQPFNELRAGKSKPARSIDATYTSIPPQLAFFRAIRSRHFTLMWICSIALLANVLAVGLGALFNEDQMIATYTQVFQPTLGARIDNDNVQEFASYLLHSVLGAQYQDHMYVVMANITSGTTLPPWVTSEYFFQPHAIPTYQGGEGNTYTLLTRGYGARSNCTDTPAAILPPWPAAQNLPKTPPYARCDPLASARNILGGLRTPSNLAATVLLDTLIDNSSERCDGLFVMAWARGNITDMPDNAINASFAVCRPVFETAMFNVTVDKLGYVLAYQSTSVISGTLDYPGSSDAVAAVLTNANLQLEIQPLYWNVDATAVNWISYLLMISMGSRSLVDPSKPIPDSKELVLALEPIYRKLFAVFLSLNTQFFEDPTPGNSVTGFRFTKETRIFMDDSAFVITMTILVLNAAVAVFFYARGVLFALPRMPTTIGSVLAYVAPSRFAQSDPQSIPGQKSRTFGFGRYIARDGGVHLGIEMDPYVVPVDPSSLKGKNRFLDRYPFTALKRRKRPVDSDTWL
ncbi:hypothetical protein G7046_g5158 [Stylonectria norvegica]|nr:hypothetical protein G7046_g5158 [Stylonectria norvegica]